MTIKMMPPLPEPTPCGYIAKTEYFYTQDQMTEYAQACIAAERERCARAVEAEKLVSQNDPPIKVVEAYNNACDYFAAKIRSGT